MPYPYRELLLILPWEVCSLMSPPGSDRSSSMVGERCRWGAEFPASNRRAMQPSPGEVGNSSQVKTLISPKKHHAFVLET